MLSLAGDASSFEYQKHERQHVFRRTTQRVSLSFLCYSRMNTDFESLIQELFKPQLEELGITQPGSKFTFEDLFGLLESPTNPQVGALACQPCGVCGDANTSVSSMPMICCGRN